MSLVDAVRQLEDLAYVERLIAASTVLQATRHHVYTAGQQVWVEVEGSHYEARAWRHAIDGRILPSSMDRGGVRRQQVISVRVCVLVIERPKVGGDQ